MESGYSEYNLEDSVERIDEILDKINEHGYDSLSAEEKEILLRASHEDEQ